MFSENVICPGQDYYTQLTNGSFGPSFWELITNNTYYYH